MGHVVTLEPMIEQFVQSQIASGRYESEAEVIRDGLRLLVEREQDSIVREGIEQARRGEVVDIDTAFQELDRLLLDREPADGE